MILLLLLVLLWGGPAWAADTSSCSTWSGQLAATGVLSLPAPDSVLGEEGLGPNLDGTLGLRLMNRTEWTTWMLTDIHYETELTGGETRLAQTRLARRYPWLATDDTPNDRTRLLHLTNEFMTDDCWRGYHRLDRALVELRGEDVRLRLGRQALTWGNGQIFNPMDLFNPFAPSDVIRDYKQGDDMAVTSVPLGQGGLDLVCVPRRNPDSGDVSWDQSSMGGKVHLFLGNTELDLLAASHYEDAVAGLGARGNIGEAVWRMDVLFTQPAHDGSAFANLVADVDRSWVWGEKNWYGLLEYFHQGCGTAGYPPANEELLARLDRGETYVLGTDYVAGKLDVELHPLVHAGGLILCNLRDPSALVQPSLSVSLAQNVDLLLLLSLNMGGHDTEFGGYGLATGQTIAPADSITCRLTWHF